MPYDYLTKPAMLDEIEAVIRKADEKRRLVRQNASLKDAVSRPSEEAQGSFVYRSKAMEGLVALAETAARADSTVIITGETGTGKEVVRALLHARRARADGPFVARQLRGAARAAARGRALRLRARRVHGRDLQRKPGLLEAATAATLFLDEVGEMPLADAGEAPARARRERDSGASAARAVLRTDVRVIAATNRDLARRR